MTLTLDFQGQIFNSHILGTRRSIDLEWKRCELDTMLDAQWASSWPTEWVIKLNSLSADSEVHIVHISCVVIAYTLESLSSLT